jgi:hypothetical protein
MRIQSVRALSRRVHEGFDKRFWNCFIALIVGFTAVTRVQIPSGTPTTHLCHSIFHRAEQARVKVFKISKFLRVAQTVLEQKILNTHPLIGVRALPGTSHVHQHHVGESQKGI